MHALSLLALATATTATFHLISQNPSDSSGNVLENETKVFAIGSDSDSQDNKCSNLISGKFSAPVSALQTFADNAQCDHGLCLLNNFDNFAVSGICGLAAGTQFFKNADGSGGYEMKSNTGAHLGSCSKADQNPTLCQAGIFGTSTQFTFGAVTDLLFCDLDNVPKFCDPAS